MSGTWREVLIEVEPRGKSFRIGLDKAATAGDIIRAVESRCKEEGVDVEGWAKEQVGRDYQFVLMRRGEANSILSPAIPLTEVMPTVIEGEEFVFGTQPVVGGFPAPILNRRVDQLIESFYSEGLAELYRQEGKSPVPF